MVGLNEFGEAAWSVEQLFNSWLADQKRASEELMSLSTEALTGFSRWIEDIAANSDTAWSASAFRTSADAMRTEGRLSALVLPAMAQEPALDAVMPDLDLTVGDFAAEVHAVVETPEPAQAAVTETDLDFDAFFGVDQPAASEPATAARACRCGYRRYTRHRL